MEQALGEVIEVTCLPENRKNWRSLEEWVSDELHVTFRRFCASLVVIEMAKTIGNILFQTVVGWWHTWSFSADYESPDVFYPILLMPIRAISWMDVGFSILFLLTCSQALGGLLKDHQCLLKPCIRSILPFLLWRLLCIIFYICVAALRTREMFMLYYGQHALIGYVVTWIILWPLDLLFFISLRRQYTRYSRGIGHPFKDLLTEF